MKVGLLLAGAGTAAVVALLVTVASVARDPQVQACGDATAAVRQANLEHLDAMRVLENRWRRGGVEAEVAGLRVDETKAELDAARAAFQLACHYAEQAPA